jgi:hypothetical protein
VGGVAPVRSLAAAVSQVRAASTKTVQNLMTAVGCVR